jgi:hypothetical protein
MRAPALSCLLVLVAGCAHADLKPEPVHPTDLSGHWVLNAAASDDAVAVANKWLSKEMRPRRQIMPRGRGQEEDDDYKIPDDEHTVVQPPPEDDDSPEGRKRHQPHINFNSERVRQVLGLVPALDITQSESGVKIATELENESYEPGRSQVSMIDGGLADSQIGWDGETFSIDRRVPHGLRVTEQYRLLNKGTQLEVRLERRGEGMFSPINLRRVYDRAAPPAAVDPNAGPSR